MPMAYLGGFSGLWRQTGGIDLSRSLPIFLIVAGLLIGERAVAQRPEEPIRQIRVGGQTRFYKLERHHIEYAHGPLPIIIYLHGTGTRIADPILTRYNIPFARLPDLEPALIVLPQGANRSWDAIPRQFNTWRRLSGLDGEQVDDIGFLRALIAELIARENGDAARVYVVGVSAGGYMIPRIACELSDNVTAVADIIATAREAQLANCPDARPVPFLLLASTTDPNIPYAGTRDDQANATASAIETVSFFARHNGCTSRVEEPLPHLEADVPSTATLIRYSGCTRGADVFFYRIDGSGHSVPSNAPPEVGAWEENGGRNRDFDTAQAVWTFFRAHH
jgi:polyhydroxybutyrate depolymerase